MRKPRRLARPLVGLTLALVGTVHGIALPVHPQHQAPSYQTPITPADAPSWSMTGNLNTARGSHTATLLPNGKVLVAGGRQAKGATNSAEIYDPASGTWSTMGSLITARANHTATLLLTGKVLIVGGSDCPSSAGDCVPILYSSAELYDPATGTWSATGSLEEARIGHTATLLPNGKVLVVGGGFYTAIGTAELYDPATETWSSTGGLARIGHTATLLPNGKVLVVGGVEDVMQEDPPYNSAELYDPATRVWTYTGSLSLGRLDHTATLLPNGKVLVAGGWQAKGATNSAEIYDPASRTWSTTGSLITARAGHTATPLPNGDVLVVGGYSYNSTSKTYPIEEHVELYDHVTETWTITSSLSVVRSGHTATLLPNGKVLVAGGWNEASGNLDSAELYSSATNSDSPVLSLDSRNYCVGAAWSLKVTSSAPNAAVRLLGTSNGKSWEIAQWATTDGNGSFTTSGKMPEGTEGTYTLSVEIGGVVSNAWSFVVSSCAPAEKSSRQ